MRIAHAHGAKVLFDGAQAVVHRRVDVQALDCDFYAFTGHKLYGPTGIGVLWGRRELLDAMPPFLGGGEMISSVSYERSTWAEVPHKFEAGTPPILEGIGLKAAIDYVQAIGYDAIAAHETSLIDHALARLGAIEGVHILGRAQDRGGVVSFSLDRAHAHDVATLLDRQGIAVRAGHHCAEPLMHRFGLESTARASFAIYTTHDEIDYLADSLDPRAGVLQVTDTFDDLRDLYQEVILDHGRRPRHARRLESFDATAKGDNPMCGDRIEVWVKYAPDGTIADTGFQARGCAISVASADLMAETVIGRSKADTHALFEAFREMARTGKCPHCDAALAEPMERLEPLAGVHEYPSRVKCATLAWHALVAALDGGKEASSE